MYVIRVGLRFNAKTKGWGPCFTYCQGLGTDFPALSALHCTVCEVWFLERYKDYLESQGDLVSRLLIGISRDSIWVMGVFYLLTKYPRLSKSFHRGPFQVSWGRAPFPS